jgi:cytochrome c oxidase subunit 2
MTARRSDFHRLVGLGTMPTDMAPPISPGSAFRRSRPSRYALLLIVALALAACSGEGPQTALEPQGKFARDIDGLWDLVFWIAVVIFILVQAALVYAILRFRERKGDERRPKQVHGNTTLEISWTILPAVILAVIAVPTVQGVFELREIPEGDDILHVTVTGHQWWWEFEYPDLVDEQGRALLTANELHIPAGREVLLTMSSADVIHSFWVPPLNGKRDVVPGKVTNLRLLADEPTPEGQPIYGQCAEYCGLAHADMRIRAFVHDEAGFAAWVAEQNGPAPLPLASTDDVSTAAADTVAGGWSTFSAVCTACHQAKVEFSDGVTELVGVEDRRVQIDEADFHLALAPNLTHFGGRETFGGASFDNVTEHLSAWLANPSDLKPMDPDRNDIAAGRILGMPNFNLQNDEIAGLVALLQSWQ